MILVLSIIIGVLIVGYVQVQGLEIANANKTVVLIFDRGYKSQYEIAVPILDKYDFKASFFVTCERADKNPQNYMNWTDLGLLQKAGHAIESHGYSKQRVPLANMTIEQIEHELNSSKSCLAEKGFNASYYSPPYNEGMENKTILDVVSRYFDFALSGHASLMFLACDGNFYGFKHKAYPPTQFNCDPDLFFNAASPTNKFAIKEWSHARFHAKLNEQYPLLPPHGANISDMLFSKFVNVTEAQVQYNGTAIPIISYHHFGQDRNTATDAELFDREMKYLHDNNFNVIRLKDLGYNQTDNYFTLALPYGVSK